MSLFFRIGPIFMLFVKSALIFYKYYENGTYLCMFNVILNKTFISDISQIYFDF